MMKKFAAAFAALAIAGIAQAYDGLPTGTSVPFTATEATAGTGFLSFTLNGYGSLDGNNCCIDVFTVTQGSTVLFSGSFNLGGGGSTLITTELPGTQITDVAGSTANEDVTWNGGELKFIIPVSWVGGENTFTFAYDSPTGVQGTGDEGWAVSGQTLAVPEASSLAMMLAGLGIVGGLARRRAARQA